MSDYEVGYGKPPKRTRFKKGICPNPKGRGMRADDAAVKAIDDILNAKVPFREGGKTKRATRGELSIIRLVNSALKGNVKDAGELLKLRKQAERSDDGPLVITLHGGVPVPGQPAPDDGLTNDDPFLPIPPEEWNE